MAVRPAGADADAAHVDGLHQAPARQPGRSRLTDSLSKPGSGGATWLRYASGRNGYRIHADTEACAGGRDRRRHSSFGAYFLRGYFILIVVAAVAAYLFTPLFNRLNKRFGTGLSATLTLLAAIASVVVPLGAVRVPRGRSDHHHGRAGGRVGRADRPVGPRRSGAALRQRCAAQGAVHQRDGHPGLAAEFDGHRRAGRRPMAARPPAGGRGRRVRRRDGGDPVPVCVHFAVDEPRQRADRSSANSTRSARRSPTSTWRRWARW